MKRRKFGTLIPCETPDSQVFYQTMQRKRRNKRTYQSKEVAEKEGARPQPTVHASRRTSS